MKIAIVGVGNLGAVIGRRLLAAGVSPSDLLLITRGSERSHQRCNELGIEPGDRADLKNQDLVILAVKPQDALEVLNSLQPIISARSVILSCMAGVSCAVLSEALSHKAIARAMPNLGAAVGESATAYFSLPYLNSEQLRSVEYVISSLGRSWRVGAEQLLDLATAVAGSGPAYLCWLGEQIERVARENGFSERDAHALVLQTFKGAVSYLETSSETFASLRARVTSPHGTTAAAISTLDVASADDVVRRAVEAACRRAQELGKVSN